MSKVITEDDILKAKSIDIVKFLEVNGHDVKQRHNYMLTSSPFTSDSNPSFVVYTDQNIYVDYSSANKGDSIDLAMKMFKCGFKEAVERLTESELPEWDEREYKKIERKRKPFKLENYITRDQQEIEQIDTYAHSRGIRRNYKHGFYYVADGDDGWEKKLAMVFPHTDWNNKEATGAKFRNIDPFDPNRFTARGRLGYFILDNMPNHLQAAWHTPLYIVESETSAISLYDFFQENNFYAAVMSFGAVGSVQPAIPQKYDGIVIPHIIIDYDGDEELYQERLKAYEHFNGIPIKLELPKGEDINSLWARGETEKLASLLL